ncbi:MAG TPA: acyl-[ACP]--phospholipid O-acyltransferase [bacterium]|nr:acyl-[ACP]--phospholipid O-acyltransferase [bacterium]
MNRMKALLLRQGFLPYLGMQFLGALNDNLFKVLVSLLAVNVAIQAGGGSGSLPLVGVVFILPFLLFSGYAGLLADRCSKRSVLLAAKSLELLAMGLAAGALAVGNVPLLLGILFLQALQSTFSSPAKYGILPEMLPERDLSRANGLLEMATFLAIILGTALGGAMYELWKDHLARIAVIQFLLAGAGLAAGFFVTSVPPSGASDRFTKNPWKETGYGLRRLFQQPVLWLTVLGITYFWFLGVLFQMLLILLGKEELGAGEFQIGLLGTALAVGVGSGSLAAGRLSGDKVELGLAPMGAFGMGLFSIVLAMGAASYALTISAMMLVGFSGGLFIVPLYAYLQKASGKEEKGRMIAANNVLNTGGVLLASGTLWLLHDVLFFRPSWIILFFGGFTIAATACSLRLMPETFVRFVMWLLTHTLYKIRRVGLENIPQEGPALLAGNHVSYMDGLLISSCVPRPVHFLVDESIYEKRALKWFFELGDSIPVRRQGRRGVLHTIALAREKLREGKLVGLFAEGTLTRTGNLLPFQRGLEKIGEGLDAPIVPMYLDGVWDSIFSYKGGRLFWKWPNRFPHPVTILFGPPLPPSTDIQEVRRAVLALATEAMDLRPSRNDRLSTRFLRTAKRRWFAFCMLDTLGRRMSYGRAAAAAITLARWLRRRHTGEERIGLLLPASVGGALANLAVTLAGKTAVNLNYTAGAEWMESALRQCEIQTVLTSRKMLEKFPLPDGVGIVFLEEWMATVPRRRFLAAAVEALTWPSPMLARRLGPEFRSSDDTAAIVFTSGSTGDPKGAMISHYNLISNVEAVSQIYDITPADRILGILPFFHTFGYSVTLWLPLLRGFGALYHPNPLDTKRIGQLALEEHATILVATPTFCQSFIRGCPPETFATLRYGLTGAEKLPEPVAAAFREKFGIELLEGYGCTETSPVIAVNRPNIQQGTICQIGHKPGSVGHPLPGISVKVIDPDTGEPLAANQEGLLLVKGPNCMRGYYGRPDLSEQVFQDGWYVTGDIARVDDDGFLFITGRLSRFSKIGGEMVPHVRVENAINDILGYAGCAVTGIPDDRKGERLVALVVNPPIPLDEVWARLTRGNLPALWLPKRENLLAVDHLPTLGSGKLDLRKINEMAREILAGLPKA